MASLLALDVVRDCTRKVRFDSAPQRGIFLTISLKAFGLLWLIVFAACGGGSASAPSCTEGQTCTPTTACHGGTISCASGAPVCVDSGVAPDGTACSSGGSCQTGVCRRTVSGAFQTTYWTDAGTKTTLKGLPTLVFGDPAATPSAILVPDGSASGYTKLPLVLSGDQSFAVSGVPTGPYFLELDAISTAAAVCGEPLTIVHLFELTTSTPDLASVTAARPDVVTPQAFPTVSFDMSNLDPWGSRDRLFIASSQARTSQLLLAFPPLHATSFTGTFDWFGGLPDASKNDAVFVYQRASTVTGNGSTVARATKFKKLIDLTMLEGTTTSATVALEAAPQTGTLGADLRTSQFAALAADVHPGASLNSFSLSVLGVPHSLTYPDMPLLDFSSIFFLSGSLVSGASAGDFDYGSLPYGQFFDPLWKDDRRTVYFFDVHDQTPSDTTLVPFFRSDEAVPASPAGPIVPVIGPPKVPRVNGADAFTARTGVGLQPTISWSAPSLGSATSYVLDVVADPSCDLSGQIVGLSAVIHGGTSFKVPPGILKPGRPYKAFITARQAPWDVLDAGPFRTGTPLHSAQLVTSVFMP